MSLRRPLKEDSNAVTSVILALLFLGLFAIMLTTIQAVYVPQWGAQHEGIHMHEVANQFAELKHTMDIQTISQDPTPITSPITLGTNQQLFLTTSRAFGSLHIEQESFSISIENTTDQLLASIGTLRYRSQNNYYVDQSYIIEGGSLIINQIEGYIMSAQPPVAMNQAGFDLTFTVYNLIAQGGKTDVSGYGTYLIQTNYSTIQSSNLTNCTRLDITSNHPHAWYLFFNNTLSTLGLAYENDYTIAVVNNNVLITFPLTTNIDIKINLVTIYVQIGIGGIN
ncbi:MAG: hypothetical protein KKC68_07660 [Candidatus Thermoplasmatota archaeon]|nr:hypothetical protein [Candidatus Thermoplasmatota archaeon]MBU1941635.1 hypothetical protein [Candidatus Thermoplasmatota archaeon]